MSPGKPQFTLYSHGAGPNPWKVAAVLEELNLSYHTVFLEKTEMKEAGYTQYNPNGRVPALIDHANDDFAVWESGAIIVYLAEKYDVDHRISASTANEKVLQLQWLFFQTSGQGPYFGQAFWFKFLHSEKLPSAIERYQKEILRVLGVLESVLSQQEWLVGGKYTVADLAFFTWNDLMPIGMEGGFDFEKQFPAVYKWHTAIGNRDAVKKMIAARKAATDKK